MSDKTKPTPTPGRWVIYTPEDYDGPTRLPGLGVESESGEAVVWAALDPETGLKNDGDAALIAAAGTANDTLETNGYDGLKLIKALPQLATYAALTMGAEDFQAFVDKCAAQVDAGNGGDDGKG